MQTIKLVVGDWSGDGHNQTEDFYIETNFSDGAIEIAFNTFIEENELDEPCEEYECRKLDKSFLAALKKNGIKVEDIYDLNHNYFDDHARSFCELYLRIARHALPNLTWTFINSDIPEINVGGYGLFD